MGDYKINLPKRELKKIYDAGEGKVEVKVLNNQISTQGTSVVKLNKKMLKEVKEAYEKKRPVLLYLGRSSLTIGGSGGSGLTTTSNFDLVEYAKKLKLSPFSVINVDEPIETEKCIYNSAKVGDAGRHWLALFIDEKYNYCFDPFGMAPDERILLKLKKLNGNVVVASTLQIQGIEESNCGQQCILWLNAMNKVVDGEERFNEMVEYCTSPHDIEREWKKLRLPFNG